MEREPMYVRCLVVRRSDLTSVSGEVYRQFKRDLKRVFPTYNYLAGYCDGYGHGKIEIKTLDEIEMMSEKEHLYYYHIFFVKLKSL